MTLEARRKNQGKQYSVVSTEDRVIRYWHRPGDQLPVILTHAGKDYLLTKEVVEEARVHQRSKLLVLKVDPEGNRLVPVPSNLRRVFKKPTAGSIEVTSRAGSSTTITTVDEEINWKAVGFVVVSLFLLGVIAAGSTLGA